MKTCMVVDDSSVGRKIARRILEELEFRIIEAKDGEKAVEARKSDLPDVVLLDWDTQVTDGCELFGNLLRLSGCDQPIVVICTTESNIDHISDALHAGSDEYVVKPFNRDAVVARFQDIRDSKISD